MKKLEKIFHLFFYKLVKVAAKSNKPHYRTAELEDGVWGATGWLSILSALLFSIIMINVEHIIQKKIISELSIFFPLVIVSIVSIYIFIYYNLLHNDRWRTYVHEFESYSKQKNILINIVVTLVVLSIIVNFAISLYLW